MNELPFFFVSKSIPTTIPSNEIQKQTVTNDQPKETTAETATTRPLSTSSTTTKEVVEEAVKVKEKELLLPHNLQSLVQVRIS